jgi:hypothetical protein
MKIEQMLARLLAEMKAQDVRNISTRYSIVMGGTE